MVVKPTRARALSLFRSAFGARPRAAASAPGRVNLIGEHTDYNGGPVLPMATPARTVAVAGRGRPGILEFVSALDGDVVRVAWRDTLPSGGAGYVAGVLRELAALDAVPADAGARVAVASAIPVGAGLASSAALSVAAGRALATLFLHNRGSARLTPRQLAGVAYRAEHDHVGVRCGVMDQTVAALARPGHALLLECASLATRQVPVRGRLAVVDTGVRHALVESAFNERRAECEAAVERLRVELPELLWLASWPPAWLPRLKGVLPEPLRARALHVVNETARTRAAAGLLQRGRLRAFGALLYESHESCRRLYQCSAPELDLVVDTARAGGALGARLTGAGWGGAVIVLSDGKREASVLAAVRRAFHEAYGRDPAITSVKPAGGARRERI